MIYCDSSFLVPLYLYEEASSEKAGKVATQFLSFDDRLNRLAKAEGMKLIR